MHSQSSRVHFVDDVILSSFKLYILFGSVFFILYLSHNFLSIIFYKYTNFRSSGQRWYSQCFFLKKRYGLYIILSKQLRMIFQNNCVNFRIKFLCNHCTILSLGKRKRVSSPTLHFFLSLAIFYKLQYKSSIPLLYAIAVNILYSVQNPIEKYVYAVLVHRSSICSSTACFVCVQTCFMGISLSSA